MPVRASGAMRSAGGPEGAAASGQCVQGRFAQGLFVQLTPLGAVCRLPPVGKQDGVVVDALMLSRIQFGFVVSFHILFPAFTIGLASWLAFTEWRWLRTRDTLWRDLAGAQDRRPHAAGRARADLSLIHI